MSLVVHPVEHADVSQCISLRIASLGSLVIGRPPPYPGYVEEVEATVHSDLDHKDYVHHLKAIDLENNGEVIAYAKWEVYPNGRPDLEKLRKPMDQSGKQVDGLGALREAAHAYFCSRNMLMGQRPHILLALLVTSNEHRRRGAGSLLVQWGVDKSKDLVLPAYLQASAQGRRLYTHHGFRDVDKVEYDLSKYGLEGIEKMTEMLREPSARTNSEAGDGMPEGP